MKLIILCFLLTLNGLPVPPVHIVPHIAPHGIVPILAKR